VVGVFVAVGVSAVLVVVGVTVEVAVRVGVFVLVFVGVRVGVFVLVFVGVLVAVIVLVFVAVFVGVSSAKTKAGKRKAKIKSIFFILSALRVCRIQRHRCRKRA
jgi:uncharacterized membrane protein